MGIVEDEELQATAQRFLNRHWQTQILRIMLLKKPELSIELKHSPQNYKYSVLDPEVRGKFFLKRNGHDSEVKIKVSLTGKANIFYTNNSTRNNFDLSTGTDKAFVRQKFSFFKTCISSIIPIEEILESEIISDHFAINFPKNFALPSTCKKFGNSEMGSINILYRIKVEMLSTSHDETSTVMAKDKKEIIYQSGVSLIPWEQIKILKYRKNKVFTNKFQKFEFDTSIKGLVPCSNNSIIQGRFKNKMLKLIQPKKGSWTIPLNMELMVMSVFDLKQCFASQVLLGFNCDLQEVGLDSNLNENLILNGQRTGLGTFFVELLEVWATCHLKVFCKQKKVISDVVVSKLVSIPFHNFQLDICDFQYNQEKKHYDTKIPLSKVKSAADVDIDFSLVEIMKENCLICHEDRTTWFNSDTYLTFAWTISDGGGQKQKFTFDTLSKPGFALHPTFLPPNQLSIPPSDMVCGNSDLWEYAAYCKSIKEEAENPSVLQNF